MLCTLLLSVLLLCLARGLEADYGLNERSPSYVGRDSSYHNRLAKRSFACYEDLGWEALAFNLIAFGNVESPSSDSEGRIAVGGDLKLSQWTVAGNSWLTTTDCGVINTSFGQQASNSSGYAAFFKYGLVVGGNADITGGEVYGYAAIAGLLSTVGQTTTFHCPPVEKKLPFDFAALKSRYIAQSAVIAARPSTASASVQWSTLYINITTSSLVQTVTITAEQLAAVSSIEIVGNSLPADTTLILNYLGTSFSFFGDMSRLQPTNRVLWNAPNLVSISFSSFYGSLLAPKATISSSTGMSLGTIIVQAASNLRQVNLPLFQGCLSVTKGSTSTVVSSDATTSKPLTTSAAGPASTSKLPSTTTSAAPAGFSTTSRTTALVTTISSTTKASTVSLTVNGTPSTTSRTTALVTTTVSTTKASTVALTVSSTSSVTLASLGTTSTTTVPTSSNSKTTTEHTSTVVQQTTTLKTTSSVLTSTPVTTASMSAPSTGLTTSAKLNTLSSTETSNQYATPSTSSSSSSATESVTSYSSAEPEGATTQSTPTNTASSQAVATSSPTCLTDPFGQHACEFSVIAVNEFLVSSGEVRGRLAVGGNVSVTRYLDVGRNIFVGSVPLSCYQVQDLGVPNFCAVFKGNVTWPNGTLNNGALSVSALNTSQLGANVVKSMTDKSCSVIENGWAALDIKALWARWNEVALNLATFFATGEANLVEDVIILDTRQPRSVHIFYISASMLARANAIVWKSAPSRYATYVFNVDPDYIPYDTYVGTESLQFGRDLNCSDLAPYANRIVWNFQGLTSIQTYVNLNFYGTVLAPNATWYSFGSSLTHSGQFFVSEFVGLRYIYSIFNARFNFEGCILSADPNTSPIIDDDKYTSTGATYISTPGGGSVPTASATQLIVATAKADNAKSDQIKVSPRYSTLAVFLCLIFLLLH